MLLKKVGKVEDKEIFLELNRYIYRTLLISVHFDILDKLVNIKYYQHESKSSLIRRLSQSIVVYSVDQLFGRIIQYI